MKLRIRWHPAIVLVLCGLPLFAYTAWRVYTGGPVRRLTLEVDAEDQVTVKARRWWVTEEGVALDLHEDWLMLRKSTCALAAETDVDNQGSRKCPVHVVIGDGVSADSLWHLIDLAYFATEVNLVSSDRKVVFSFPRYESAVRVLGDNETRLAAVGDLLLSGEAVGKHELAGIQLRQVLSVDGLLRHQLWNWSFGPSESWCIGLGRAEWDKLTTGTSKSPRGITKSLDDMDFSDFDAVGIRWGRTTLARDLVRAIAAIKANDPAPKIILVVPDPE
ncbi:MAG: hypothetical protein ACYTFI_15525 [Planctomycetota bacterium]